ncbi:MAG: hypothetical protein H6705_15750 [Myxococcales bacterium]|nr:hypothetical protein [Myxococcales bacterium]
MRTLARTVAVASLLLASCAEIQPPLADGGLDAALDLALPPLDAPDQDITPPDPDDAAPAADAEADIEPIGPCVPTDEICNQRDDDCDLAVDEGAVCCRMNAEQCNGRDDDCDGAVDEGAGCCVGDEVETCNALDDDCDGAVDEGDVCCGVEVCNGQDDDCDGVADEGDACCAPVDEICDGADQDCDGAIDEGGVCCAPEGCNGQDDDCDGAVDEASVCGLFVQQSCRLFLAWADSRRGPAGASPVWGGCPAQDVYRLNAVHCVGTRYDGNFAVLDVDGDVDETDQFAFSLTCRDTGDPALSAWVQSHCALYLGYADNNRAPGDVDVFGACPPAIQGRSGSLSCTSTGYDGLFRALNTEGDVDDNDDLAIAWKCSEDPARPGLAAVMQSQVEVFLGWADEDRGPANGSPGWAGCPAVSRSYIGDTRCVGTRGDGRFNRLDLGGDVNGDDMFGVALRAR